MTVLIWMVFGLILGFAAHVLDTKPSEGGIWGAILLGICGAFLEGFFANVMIEGGGLNLTFSSISLAMLGALLLLMLGHVVRRT